MTTIFTTKKSRIPIIMPAEVNKKMQDFLIIAHVLGYQINENPSYAHVKETTYVLYEVSKYGDWRYDLVLYYDQHPLVKKQLQKRKITLQQTNNILCKLALIYLNHVDKVIHEYEPSNLSIFDTLKEYLIKDIDPSI